MDGVLTTHDDEVLHPEPDQLGGRAAIQVSGRRQQQRGVKRPLEGPSGERVGEQVVPGEDRGVGLGVGGLGEGDGRVHGVLALQRQQVG